MRPVVLEQVAVDQYPARILQLEQILDRPGSPGVSRVPDFPRQGFGEAVVSDFDIRWNKIRNRRVSASKHHVLARSFKVIVHDLERPGPVPSVNGLRVRAHFLEIRQVRINDCGVA